MQIIDILNYFNQFDNVRFEILVWCKTNPAPSTNNKWLPDIEYCLYFRENDVKLNPNYEYKQKWYSSPINKKDKDLFEHPTIKPLPFVTQHLLHATQPNDIVLDTFIGGGTTAIACKNIGRNFIGFEIEQKWCDIANDRLNGIDSSGQQSMFLR